MTTSKSDDALDISWLEGDQICLSNTFMAFVFTIFTFSSSCSVIVGLQLLNVREKEKTKIHGLSKKSLLKAK